MRSIAGCKPIHPHVRRSVQAHARRIFLSRRVPHLSQADIAQELYAAFYERQNKYDSSRASFRTFAERIVKNCAESLVESAQAEKRGRDYDIFHFSDIPVENEAGECLDIEDTIGRHRLKNGLIPSAEDQMTLVVDVHSVVYELPRSLQESCFWLLCSTVCDAARRSGLCAWTIHQRRKTIRQRFVDAGLDAYIAGTPQSSPVSGK